MQTTPNIWRPRLGPVRAGVFAVERFADQIFTSRWNPLYKAGTIAVVSLAILIVTGTYLLCFYGIAAPYESVQRLEDHIFLGGLMRSVHRLASDMCLLFSVLHLVQVLVRGKTFGPRRIAWWSGFFLVALILVTAWTGFVMVWDLFGQKVALLGADLLRVVPFLRDTLAQAFDGATPLLESFFFMNLFLHVALPIGIIGGLWVHTSRLTRPMWFPRRATLVGTTLLLVAVSLLTPIPLPPKADLLTIVGQVPTDWWYAFWFLPLSMLTPSGFAVLIGLTVLTLLSVPFWLKPRQEDERTHSTVNAERCTGCTQCVRDCPYQAIRMVPGRDGRRLLAEVNPAFCVSCGVCVASCDDEAIGPSDRQAGPERARWRSFVPSTAVGSVGIVACSRNRELCRRLEARGMPAPFAVDCIGALHHSLVVDALQRYQGLLILGCPAEACENRVGPAVCAERLSRTRVPFLPKNIDPDRIVFAALSDAELGETEAHFRVLKARFAGESCSAMRPGQAPGMVRAVLAAFTAVMFLTAIAWIGYASMGETPAYGMLRVSARIRGLGETVCRELSEDERVKRPKHMQAPVCTTERPPYRLRIAVDGVERVDRIFAHLGVRGDAPLFIHDDIRLLPGSYAVQVAIEPAQGSGSRVLAFTGAITIAAGRIQLLAASGEETLSLRGS